MTCKFKDELMKACGTWLKTAEKTYAWYACDRHLSHFGDQLSLRLARAWQPGRDATRANTSSQAKTANPKLATCGLRQFFRPSPFQHVSFKGQDSNEVPRAAPVCKDTFGA